MTGPTSPAAATAAAHVIVTGRVQGVGFRDWTERTAYRLGLSGWVRNRRDGTVEAVFAGDPDAVAEMLKALHAGPASARVDGVRRLPDPEPDSISAGFEARPTV
jgi:acylphosphatase